MCQRIRTGAEPSPSRATAKFLRRPSRIAVNAHRTAKNMFTNGRSNPSMEKRRALGWVYSQHAVFFPVPVFAVLSGLAVLSIPAAAIDQNRARGLDNRADARDGASGWTFLLECRPLLIFAGCTLLHFGNAPLLPLVGQKLATSHPTVATATMSACIIAAQLIMLPIALLVGYRADTWGRKPIFLTGFAILPICAFLYTLSDNSVWLVAVQLLDGVGAGIYGALI